MFPPTLRFILGLGFLLLIILPEHGTRAWHNSFFFPIKCKEFKDERRVKLQTEIGNNTQLVIPRYLTSTFKEDITFNLKNSDGAWLHATQHEELCSNPWNITANLTGGDLDNSPGPLVPPSIQEQSAEGIMREPTPEIYFTVDGYLHEDNHFYSPDDYCISLISDKELVMKTCKPDCSADLSNTYLFSSHERYSLSRVCIPKCCGVDETLSPTTLKCRKLNHTEPLYFIPYLHLPKPIWFLEEDKTKDKYSTLIHSNIVSERRRTWNRTHAVGTGSSFSIWDMLHFYTPADLSCKNGTFIYETFKWDDVQPGRMTMNPFRLAVAPDHVQPQYLTRSRTWRKYDTSSYSDQFCVDGMDGWGVGSLKTAVVQTVVMCSSDNIKLDPRLSLPPISPETWLHIMSSLFSSILLLLTFLIFVGIYKTLNSQEHVILSHCASIAALYITATLGRLNYLTVSGSTAGNAVVEPPEDDDDGVTKKNCLNLRNGTGCMIIAVLHHYFQYTTYFWLTIMNYDIWRRVPVLRMAGKRNIKEMTVYSLIAWGIPALLIIIFVIVDECYNDPFMEVIVPDYAKEYCTVASWSAGYYVHLPIVILLGLNLILILNRLDKWCRQKCREDAGEIMALNSRSGKGFSSDLNCARVDEPTFSPTLFSLLWCIHLVAWLIDMAVWMKLFRNHYDLDWEIIVLQYVALLGIPMLLFHLYCMNEDVLGRVGTKYSALDGLTTKLRNSKLIWKKSFTRGKGQYGNCGNDNDTVVIDAK